MSELVYLYDGSFDGFLCCIFESYARKEVLTAVYSSEDFAPLLYETRMVDTDRTHAQRVYRGIVKRSPQAADLLRRGFLTCLPGKELALYRLAVRLFREGSHFLGNLSDPTLYPILKAIRFLGAETEKFRGFVRFSEFSGVLGAEIEPKNRVLPLLRSHFCSRYQNECFFIYDRTHREVLLYADGKSVIRPLEAFRMAPPDEKEASFRLLWKKFYDTIAIKERENPRCRMSHMPKRYWTTMTEFQDEAWFRVQVSPEAAAAPVVPNGISAPGIPAGSWPSAPVSGP